MIFNILYAVKEEWKDRLAISAEDYLHGLISLVNELVCLSIDPCKTLPRCPFPRFVSRTIISPSLVRRSISVVQSCPILSKPDYIRLTTIGTVSPCCECGNAWKLRRTYQNINFRKRSFCGFLDGKSMTCCSQRETVFHTSTQLNLKNDTLRRRFDSLKYDIKKIEEGKHFRTI
jgi:hypothetical protein